MLWQMFFKFFDANGLEILKLIGTLVCAFFGTFGLQLYKDWKEGKRNLDAEAHAEEQEERDWQLRCIRTQTDLENLDRHYASFDKKLEKLLGVWGEAIKLLSKPGATQAEQVLAAQLQYICDDLACEIEVHREERPQYLTRIQRINDDSLAIKEAKAPPLSPNQPPP